MVDILLVEDDPGDVLITREAFSVRGIESRLHVVGDGIEALQFLRRQPPYVDAPRPSLVLLDLNLPRMDGRAVLDEIKSDPGLCDIAVVILSTSSSTDEVLRSYQSHANAYVVKPTDFQRFTDVIYAIDEFYGGIVRLP